MTGWRRTVRWIVIGLGAILGTVLALALVLFAFALTEPGERALERLLVSQIDERIAGRVSVGELEYRGDELELVDVVLLTPAEERVASAARVLVDLSLPSLLKRQLRIERLHVSEWNAQLWQREGDWNLRSATAPVAPPAPDQEPWTRDVSVDELRVTGGDVLVTLPARAGTSERRQVHLRELELEGHAGYLGERLEADLRGQGQVVAPFAAPLTLGVRAGVEAGRQTSELGLSVGEHRLRLLARLPESAQLAELSDAQLEQLDARVEVDVPEFETGGFRYGPVRVLANVAGGRFDVARAHVELPGLRLVRDPSLEGDGFAATLHVDSLATTLRALATWTGRAPAALAGQGRLSLRLQNPVAAARLDLEGEWSELRTASATARGVHIEMRIDDVWRLAQAQLSLSAASLTAESVRLTNPRLSVRQGREGELVLEAETGPPYAARLAVQGELDDARRGLDVRQLSLSYPNTRWEASQPARLRWGEGETRVEDLELVSGGQRLALELDWGARARRARAELGSVQLASLPEALFAKRPGPRGVVSGELHVEQTGPSADSRSARAELTLSEGEWSGIRGVSAKLAAVSAGERASGSFSAQALSGTASGRFDVPTRFPPPQGAPLDARLEIHGMQLAQAFQALVEQGSLPPAAAQLRDLSGRLEAVFALGGKWPRPDAALTFELHGGALRFREQRYQDVTLLADAQRDRLRIRRLSARTATGNIQGQGQAVPIDSAQEPAGGDAWRYGLELTAQRFALPLEEPLLADFRARVEGTATSERIRSEITFEKVRVVPPTSARSTGALRPDDGASSAELQRHAASGGRAARR